MPNQGHQTQFTWASERHLRIHFAAADSQQLHERTRQALLELDRSRPRGLVGMTPTNATIVLEFEPAGLNEKRIVDEVRRILASGVEMQESVRGPLIEIPACYEAPCAPDAEDVARIHGITLDDLIQLHSQQEYVVQFIGFAPGFAYLGTLPKQLITPRLAAPRIRVPPGSVGIAADLTGIYPRGTAGGWRLIARTPVVMFDARREKPSLLAADDRIRFVPITLAEFNAQSQGQARP